VQIFWVVVFWVVFFVWVVVWGLFGCGCGCDGAFSMLVVAVFRLLVDYFNMVVYQNQLVVAPRTIGYSNEPQKTAKTTTRLIISRNLSNSPTTSLLNELSIFKQRLQERKSIDTKLCTPLVSVDRLYRKDQHYNLQTTKLLNNLK
jgi:hypothetical protein